MWHMYMCFSLLHQSSCHATLIMANLRASINHIMTSFFCSRQCWRSILDAPTAVSNYRSIQFIRKFSDILVCLCIDPRLADLWPASIDVSFDNEVNLFVAFTSDVNQVLHWGVIVLTPQQLYRRLYILN